MLLCTKTHFIRSLQAVLAGKEGPGTDAERQATGQAMAERIRLYATDKTAKNPGAEVWAWKANPKAKAIGAPGAPHELVAGKGPQIGQRVVYVDGGFDLFSSGHIAFLQRVLEAEEARARADGWYAPEAVAERRGKTAGDYPPAFVVAGVHDDEVINEWKGINYPIMNIYERGLCVLQCKVSWLPPVDLPPFFPQRLLTDQSTLMLWCLEHRLRRSATTWQHCHGAFRMPCTTAPQRLCR